MITQQTLTYEDHDAELAFLADVIARLNDGRVSDAKSLLQRRHMELQAMAVPKLVPYDPRAEA